MPELHTLATYYQGNLWIAETDGQITGMIAARPINGGQWEICRVYVSPTLHGAGLGHELLTQAETHAIRSGAHRLILFSDTRFDRAHAFYEKRSYLRQGPVRILHDLSNSLEYAYAKPVNGVETLDIAGARSAARRLAEVLAACVSHGATITFLPPMTFERAQTFWHRCAKQAGAGERVIVAAWRDGILQASGSLDLALAENQPHVAEVQKIMVDPAARRSGLARQVMRALEAEAIARGKTLLMLDTRADAAGDSLYRSEGWTQYGRVPGHAVHADGSLIDTTFFYKRLTEDGVRPSVGDDA